LTCHFVASVIHRHLCTVVSHCGDFMCTYFSIGTDVDLECACSWSPFSLCFHI